jgi:hypothetical protein
VLTLQLKQQKTELTQMQFKTLHYANASAITKRSISRTTNWQWCFKTANGDVTAAYNLAETSARTYNSKHSWY